MAHEGSLLLALPDNCLLAVLQYCAADDLRSLFNAARAHSRLHQAASGAPRVIDAPLCQQQQADSLLLFLAKHIETLDLSESVDKIAYTFIKIILRQLPRPRPLQLRSLLVRGLQLGPGYTLVEGVLGIAAAADLQVLSLQNCYMTDSATADGLAADLWRLTALEHLSISDLDVDRRDSYELGGSFQFPTAVSQQLLQLTYLQLAGVEFLGPAEDGPTLHHLQALTRLAVLQLSKWKAEDNRITASVLSGMQHLTRLEVTKPPYESVHEPGMLAGRTRLPHLTLRNLRWGAGVVTELLSHLEQLQQLTHLNLENCYCDCYCYMVQAEPQGANEAHGVSAS